MPSTTYTVDSFLDNDPGGTSTTGTLRHVLDLANANHTGTAALPDLIQFSVGAGTINVSSADGLGLGLASNEVAVIDGDTATGYSGTPLITSSTARARRGRQRPHH